MTTQVQAPVAQALTRYEPISEAARQEFQDQGLLLLRNVLSEGQGSELEEAVDWVYTEERAAGRIKPDSTLHLLGFLPRDRAFAQLLDLPSTFPYV